MSKPELDKAFWEERYTSGDMGWDIGYPSTPIKEYIDQLTDKDIKILIPGCGNAYEAEYLFIQGFSNVYLVDISTQALENFQNRVPGFPKEHLLNKNFFEVEDQFDLIIEQTFFCAINPKLRPNYAQQVKKLLKPNGKLVGLLFDDPLNTEHPPFGGNEKEYRQYFEPIFSVTTMKPSYNSIPPRAGRELFVIISNDR